MALTGTYTRSLDEKQRLAIPKRLRDEFEEDNLNSFYVAPGTDNSLAVYSPAGFDRLARKLAHQPANRDDVRKFLRLFYARAERVDLDAQGRVRLPERLMTLAGIEREVVLLGVHDHAEIWSAPAWEKYLAQHSPDFDNLAAQAFLES